MPYANYTLPVTGEIISWQEFFGTLVAKLYNESDLAEFKIVTKHSAAEIEKLGSDKVAELKAKFDIKLEKCSKEIARADLQQEKTEAGPVKEALRKQLETLRTTRSAILAQQTKEVTAVEQKYAAYHET
eukprot:7386848-Prymnesium_polylepis.1